jgi:hypothetical protein
VRVPKTGSHHNAAISYSVEEATVPIRLANRAEVNKAGSVRYNTDGGADRGAR